MTKSETYDEMNKFLQTCTHYPDKIIKFKLNKSNIILN